MAQTATLQVIDVTDNITITQNVPLLFTSADPHRSSVEAVPDTLIADGLTTATITVTLRDQNDDPLPGKPIVLDIDGVDAYLNGQLVTGTVSLGNADVDGMVTAVITSTTPGIKTITAFGDGIQLDTQAQVTFTVGPVDVNASQLTVDTNSVVANSSSQATVTATLVDSYGHPVSGKEVATLTSGTELTLTQPITVTNISGQVQAVLSSTEVQDVIVTAVDQTDGITLTQTVPISFVAGPSDPPQSTIVISPTTALADGVQTITVTAALHDALGHPAVHRRVYLIVAGNGNVITPSGIATTDANGEINFTLASTVVEIKDISLRDVDYDVVLSVGQVEFVHGDVNTDVSTLATDKTTVTAGGADEATLTATLLDSNGHPIPNKHVVIQAVDETAPITVTQPVTLTNSQGQVLATVRAATPQIVVMTAVDRTDGITLTQTVTLTFIAAGPDAGNSVIVITPTTAVADNAQTITIDATLQDALGNPVAVRGVELLVGGSANTLSPANPAETDANGQVTWTLASSWAESKTLQIRDTVTGDLLALETINFVAGPVDAAASTMQVSAQTAPADGATPITVTIQLRDAFDNPVPDATAVISTATIGVAITQPPTPSDSAGNLVGFITGTTYEPAVIMIVADGVTLDQTETLHFEGPDLAMSKSGPGVGVIGREVTYTLTLENNGLLAAADVQVTDVLPAYMSYIRQTSPFTPTLNNGDPTWQIGDLAIGASAQITLVARLNAGAALDSQLINQATATTATAEEDTANNLAEAALTVGPGFVYDLTGTPVDQTTAVGGQAVYDIAIQNNSN